MRIVNTPTRSMNWLICLLWLSISLHSAFANALANTSLAPASGPDCKDAHAGCFPKTQSNDWVVKSGLVTTVIDPKTNTIYLVLKPSTNGQLGRFIYQTYLRQGLGSTPVGLDRSQSGPTQIIDFEQHGDQVAITVENSAFVGAAGAEARSVKESFAGSLTFLSPITERAVDGSVLVNVQKWLSRDAFGVIDRLRASHQGDFRVDNTLMLTDADSVAAFVDNIEIDVSQTFVSDKPGSEVEGIIPDRHALTLGLHHSLIRLPKDGYTPLEADPRTGAISSTIQDYSQPLSLPIVRQLAHRFRLEKTDPNAPRSTVVKPIIFYVDNAAPPDIQKDLIEGASWWAKAFDKAGFIDAFKVEPLPEGASVLDARYNVINWVHRQTRGWSYGENVIDPRTGEIIRGAVLLGSLRARQDRIIFEGLVGAQHTGSGDAQDPLKVVHARLRQLAAHETGHAIGLEHNFSASTYDDRASVMDYPPPRVSLKNGAIDLSDAYKVGLGSWDDFAIHWLYGQVNASQNSARIHDEWVKEAYAQGQRFVADSDARPVGSGVANGALWDDGTNPIEGLERSLAVRRVALNQFGTQNIRQGAPLYELRRTIVPIYLFHRYEVEAAAKWIGGSFVNYAVNGDGLSASTPVSGAQQRLALKLILRSISAETLELSDDQLNLLSAGEGDRHPLESERELFESNTQPRFSLEAAVGAASDQVFTALWAPARLNRVSQQIGSTLTLPELLNTPLQAIIRKPYTTAHGALIQETLLLHAVASLRALAHDHDVSPRVQASIDQCLAQLKTQLATQPIPSSATTQYVLKLLKSEPDSHPLGLEPHMSIPPGMPIGSATSDEESEWEGIHRLSQNLWDFE